MLASKRRYYQQHRDAILVQQRVSTRRYYQQHLHVILARQRARSCTDAYPARKRLYNHKYYQKNKAKEHARYRARYWKNLEMSRAKRRAQYYRRTQRDPSVDRLCDGFGMSLLGGRFPAGPWFQNTVALGAFGLLAPRYDWIPAWFIPPAPTHPPVQDTSSSEDDEDFNEMAQALDSLIEERPQRACRRLPTIEESSSSSDEEEEEDAASHIQRAARCRVRTAWRHHQEGMERTVRAAQHTQHMKELVDEVGSWVPDLDQQLERFAASLEREVIVDCPADNTTMDEFEQWLGLSLL